MFTFVTAVLYRFVNGAYGQRWRDRKRGESYAVPPNYAGRFGQPDAERRNGHIRCACLRIYPRRIFRWTRGVSKIDVTIVRAIDEPTVAVPSPESRRS
ncbi:hypothetical protein Trydic_g3100 [Trypoxylus dichotomus]